MIVAIADIINETNHNDVSQTSTTIAPNKSITTKTDSKFFIYLSFSEKIESLILLFNQLFFRFTILSQGIRESFCIIKNKLLRKDLLS